MQDIILAPDKVLNSLLYGSHFGVVMRQLQTVIKIMVGFLLLKLIGIFGVLSFL